jgi:fibronectin type III domain protein
MEWLVLLLVAPAVLVPIVLLYGFAGCKFTPPRPGPSVPVVTATPKNVDRITVSWQNTETEFMVTGYHFVRKLGDAIEKDDEVDASVTEVEDTGLTAFTDYTYEVSAITTGGTSGPGTAMVTTFERALAVTVPPQDQTVVPDNYCFVHRIAGGQLLADGGKVAFKVRGAPAGNATINRVFVSRVGAGNPWDSAGDLTSVLPSPLTLPNDVPQDLEPVDYALDQTQDLIVAFDFTALPGAANLRFAAAPGVTLFFKQGVQQASQPTRDPDFNTQADPRLYFVVTIGVA